MRVRTCVRADPRTPGDIELTARRRVCAPVLPVRVGGAHGTARACSARVVALVRARAPRSIGSFVTPNVEHVSNPARPVEHIARIPRAPHRPPPTALEEGLMKRFEG